MSILDVSTVDVRPRLPAETEELSAVAAAFARDRLTGLLQRAEATDSLPADLLRRLADQGLSNVGVCVPHGGGADRLTMTAAVQRLATVSPLAGMVVAEAHSALLAVADKSVGELNGLLEVGGLPVLVDPADPLCAIEVSRGSGGSRTDAGWTVHGRAARVEGARDATQFVVLDPEAGALVLEPSTPGCRVGEPLARSGLRGLAPCPVSFDRVSVAAEGVVAAEPTRAVRTRLLLRAAVAGGIAEHALTAATAYTQVRTQFGRALGEFPVVRQTLKSMADDVTDGLCLLASVAESGDRDESAGSRAEARCASTASRLATVAVRVAERAIQLHGGYGYLAEYPVERALRDALSVRALVAAAVRRGQPRSSARHAEQPGG